MKNIIPEDESTSFLKQIMLFGINGGGGLHGARELADKYSNNPEYQAKREQIDALIKWESRKNFTSGFLTSLGGIITLPVSIPASLGINWIIQTRMVAAMAHIEGFDIDDPPVRMSIALCLLGKKGKEILNHNFEDAREMLKKKGLANIPKRTIIVVNQAIASRLMQIAARNGFSRISKAIPIVGGMVGGVLDYQACLETAEFAKELFQFKLPADTKY